MTETENTLRFGLFMMTLMYFRVMALLRREKSSWNGEDELGGKSNNKGGKGGKGGPVATITRERLRMIEEETNTKARLARMEICMLKYRVVGHRLNLYPILAFRLLPYLSIALTFFTLGPLLTLSVVSEFPACSSH